MIKAPGTSLKILRMLDQRITSVVLRKLQLNHCLLKKSSQKTDKPTNQTNEQSSKQNNNTTKSSEKQMLNN